METPPLPHCQGVGYEEGYEKQFLRYLRKHEGSIFLPVERDDRELGKWLSSPKTCSAVGEHSKQSSYF